MNAALDIAEGNPASLGDLAESSDGFSAEREKASDAFILLDENVRNVSCQTPAASEAPLLSPGETRGVVNGYQADVGDVDPAAAGEKVVSSLLCGVGAIIEAGETTRIALRQFGNDTDKVAIFIGVLANAKVLSKAEARAGRDSSKLSKLRTIGEYATLLRRRGIFEHLPPAYSVIYEVPLLFKELAGDEETRVAGLIEYLSRHDGELSREYLISERKLLKHRNRTSDAGHTREPSDTFTDLRVMDFNADLVLATPHSEDLRRLEQDYADEDTLAQCLTAHELVADVASAVVITRLRDLPVVVGKLLPIIGFGSLRKILLLRRPTTADVSDNEIAVIATRLKNQPMVNPATVWSGDGEPFQATSFASQFAPNSLNRLHLFASSNSVGWHSVVGDNNWTEKPSLK